MFDNILLSYNSCFAWRNVLPIRPAIKSLCAIVPLYWRYPRYTIWWGMGRKIVGDESVPVRADLTKLKPFLHRWLIYRHPEWHYSMSQIIHPDDCTTPTSWMKHKDTDIQTVFLSARRMSKLTPDSRYGYTGNINAQFQAIVDNKCALWSPKACERFNGWPVSGVLNICTLTHEQTEDFLPSHFPEPKLTIHQFTMFLRQFGVRQAVSPLPDSFYASQN